MQKLFGWKCLPILALLVALCMSSQAFASGSYAGRPPRPPSSVDRGLYEMGKKVFAGEFATATAPDNAASQADILGDLHERLPRKARTKSTIKSYAGQLTAKQIEALRYFLKKRYKIS